MFDIGWQELFIVAVFALIVVGPKDLPQAIRTITGWIRKARMMARDFQSGVNDMVREAELDDVKDQLTRPGDLKKQISDTIDPDGEISKGLVLDEDDEKRLGSVPLDGVSGEDMENMTGDNASGGDADETGSDRQFEILNQPEDEDVMPVGRTSSAKNKNKDKEDVTDAASSDPDGESKS